MIVIIGHEVILKGGDDLAREFDNLITKLMVIDNEYVQYTIKALILYYADKIISSDNDLSLLKFSEYIKEKRSIFNMEENKND